MEGNQDASIQHETVGKTTLTEYSLLDLQNPISRRRLLTHLSTAGLFTAIGAYGQGIPMGISYALRGEAGDKHETLPIMINGVSVRLVGVDHDMQSYQKNKTNIEASIDRAPFVVLEWFPESEHKFALPTMSDEVLLNEDRYFGALGKLCAQRGKDVIVVDPLSEQSRFLEGFIGAGITSYTAGVTVPEVIDAALKKKATRRDFLKFLPQIPAAIALGSWFDTGRALRNTLEKMGIMDDPNLSQSEKADLLAVIL